jgi:hypothetical protein
MRNDDEAGPQFAIQLQHQFENLRRIHPIQVSRRFIGKHQLGSCDQCAGHCRPLALSA